MNLFLVRHGECTHKKKSYLGSGSDVSINDEGISQIINLSETIKMETTDELISMYSSSLKRGLESANIISQKLGISNFKVDSRLNEINFGIWEGLTYNEIMSKWKDIAEPWYNNPFDITPPEAESYDSFYKRVFDFYNEIIKEKSSNVIIVSHGGVLQILLTLLNSDTIDNRWNYNIPRGDFIKIKIMT